MRVCRLFPNELVFGGDKPDTEETAPEVEEVKAESEASTPTAPIEPKSDVKLTASSSLMEKLQLQPKEATKRFTVDLEESLHRDLSILAAQTGRTKADIVRMLLRDAIQNLKQ